MSEHSDLFQRLRDYFFDPDVCPNCGTKASLSCSCADPPSFASDDGMAMRLASRINACEDHRFLLRMVFGRQLELFDFKDADPDKPVMPEFFPCMDGNHARAITDAAKRVLELRGQEVKDDA